MWPSTTKFLFQFHFQIYQCTNGVHLEVELENHLNALETSVIQLELGKEFGGTGLHLEVELEKVFQLPGADLEFL